MPRITTDAFLVAVTTLMVLLLPDISFWIQLYLGNKDSHGDIDAYLDEKHRNRLRTYFCSNSTFVACPDGDKHRDRVTIGISGGVDVQVEFKYSKYPEASSFAGSYGGFFYILLLPSIRGIYGQNVSIIDGHIVFTEGKIVVPIMTLHEFLLLHNFIHSTSQEQAFPTIQAIFDAWSISTCFFPSAVDCAFQKSKKRDARVTEMYNAFTTWLTSKGIGGEKQILTQEQCQNNAMITFPTAWEHYQQAVLQSKEILKKSEYAKSQASITNIGIILSLNTNNTCVIKLLATTSRFLQGIPNEGDKKHTKCQECIALYEQFKDTYEDFTIAFTHSTEKKWSEYVRGMWQILNIQ